MDRHCSCIYGGYYKKADPTEPPIIDAPEIIQGNKLKGHTLQANHEEKKRGTIHINSSSDEDDEDEDDTELNLFNFPPQQESFKDLTAFSRCFVLNLELDFSTDPKAILKQTAKCLNKALLLMKKYMQFHAIPGKAALVPWSDDYIYTYWIVPCLLILNLTTKPFYHRFKQFFGITVVLMERKLRQPHNH